jgi:hypothetical protein
VSDQSLREALETLVRDRESNNGASAGDYVIAPYEVRELLAAHPVEPARDRVDLSGHLAGGPNCPQPCPDHGGAEPAPVVTNKAATIARHVYWEQQAGCTDGLSAMRAALEAAAPLLGPRPLLDRDAVRRILGDVRALPVTRSMNPHIEAVVALARPMPTREQIDELLQLHRVGPAFRPADPRYPGALPNYRRKLRNALLALLNGAKS